MNRNEMEYIKKESSFSKVIRTEILFTPLLIIFPLIVGFFLIYGWFENGFNPMLFSSFILGIIIIIGNIAFDITFIRSLIDLSKKNKK
jgi:hypothetical protein